MESTSDGTLSANHPTPLLVQLSAFNFLGFSLENVGPESTDITVLTSFTMTSDHPDFHPYMWGIAADLNEKLRSLGHDRLIERSNAFAVVVNSDRTAALYIDNLSAQLDVVVKRSVIAGEQVFKNDVGDIRRVRLKNIDLTGKSGVIISIRYGWKFLLVFDLTPGVAIDVDKIERTLGLGLRRLMFEETYQALENSGSLARLLQAGWFPFNELLGSEFENIHRAVTSDLNVASVEREVIASFSASRLRKLVEKWWRHPLFEKRKDLLTEGVELFIEGRHIASLKVLISEIEGILYDICEGRPAPRRGIEKILKSAFEDIIQAVSADSLYFPSHFLEYLRRSIFISFDPNMPTGEATRHTVAHGRAPVEKYTPVRSLQTILVLDQISRFICLQQES